MKERESWQTSGCFMEPCDEEELQKKLQFNLSHPLANVVTMKNI